MLYASLPLGLDGVDCNGTEASISECATNSNFDDNWSLADCEGVSTVLACADTATGKSASKTDQRLILFARMA